MKKKYSFLLEIMVGIGIIIAFNALWLKYNLGFVGISPNPYWIVIIFIAVRYGAFQGFIAGLLCSLALLGSVSYNMAIDQQFEFAKIPAKQVQLSALFVLIGFLIGEERSRVNRILAKWREKYNKLRDEFESVALEHLALKDVNVELEGRILGQVETVNTVYEVARDLVVLEFDRLYPSVIELVKKFIAPDKCSFYVLEDGKFTLKGESGWGEEAVKHKTLDTNSDIIKKALSDKRTVTVSDIYRTEKLKWQYGKDPVMAAPLFFGEEKDSVTGFILVDEIPFLKLNPNSVRFLSVIADWVSRSLDNAFSTTTVRTKDIYDEKLGIFNYNYALRRLKEELVNTQVGIKKSSVMFIKVKDFDKIDESRQGEALKALAFVLTNTLRGGDVVAKYLSSDTVMAILPGTDAEGAKIAADRVKQEIHEFDFKPFKDIGKKLNVKVATSFIDPKFKSETEFLNAQQKVIG